MGCGTPIRLLVPSMSRFHQYLLNVALIHYPGIYFLILPVSYSGFLSVAFRLSPSVVKCALIWRLLRHDIDLSIALLQQVFSATMVFPK